MKITYASLRRTNLNFVSPYLTIKALIKIKIIPAFYLIVLMGLPHITTGQVPQKDKSQTLTIEYVAFIDLLQDGEHYDIEMIHAGCFNQSAEILSVFKKGNSYIALFNSQERNLNDAQIAALRNFENELRYINGGGCSTTETYILRYGSEKLKFSDASCTHWFAKKLKKKLDF